MFLAVLFLLKIADFASAQDGQTTLVRDLLV
jgi:hypothetical protein